MDERKRLALLAETKLLLRSILGSAKEVVATKLVGEYKAIIGQEIPYRRLNFPDLHSFIQSVPDVVRIGRNNDGDVVYKEVSDDKTKHLAHFTKATKKKRSAKAKPHPAYMRRPVTPRSAFSRGRTRGGVAPSRGRGGFVPSQSFQSRNFVQNVRPNQNVQPFMQNNFSARGRMRPNVANNAPRYHGNQQPSRPFAPRSSFQSRPPRFSPPRSNRARSPPLPIHNENVVRPRQGAPQAQPWRAPTTVRDPVPMPAPARAPAPAPSPAPVKSTTSARRRGAVNRCFNRAISQLMDQENRDRLQIHINNTDVADEAKAAAAVAVSTMKHIPPRFAKLSQDIPDRTISSSHPEPAASVEEEEWEDLIVVDEYELEEGEIVDDEPQVPQVAAPATPAVQLLPVVAGVTMEEDDVILPADTIEIQSLKTDYKTLLMQHCQRMHTRPHYESLSMGSRILSGFACTVKALNKTYGSYGVFRSAKEAEVAAAHNACEELGLLRDDKTQNSVGGATRKRTTASDFDTIKLRVQQILEKKKNGLFMSRLSIEYKEQFKDEPPSNLLEKLEEWSDIVSIESFDDSNRKILYPRAQSAIKLTEQEALTLSKIPEAETFKPGSRTTVGMCQIYDCSHFYVQQQGSSLPELMAKLQEIYEARGSPKPLIQAEPGTYCVARFLADEQWYRAEILNVSKKGEETVYDVLYVDYGNCETVSSQCVRRILDNLCTLPAQAVRCCLSNCYPPQGDNWDVESEAVAEMMKLTMVDNDEEIIMHVDKVDCDKGCSVRLFRGSDLDRDLSQWLVLKDMASAQPVSEEPAPLELPDDGEWDVYVCYINTTTDIVVRLVGPETSEKLSALEESLSIIAISSMKLNFGADGPKKGSVCMVKLDGEDGVCFHRARVVAVEDEKVLVEFLDHGDKDVVDRSCVKILPAKYNQLPYQAIQAKLTGLEAFENHESVRDKLMDLAFGKTCVADVDDRMDIVSLTLWDTSTDDDMNINEMVAKVLNIEDLAPKTPGKGGTLEGYVSYVNESGQLYFQVQGPGLQAMEAMAEEMARIYEKESTAEMFVSKPELNKVYACKTNENWHRVKICDILRGRRVDVYFVDYGYQDVVHVSLLRTITSQNKHIHGLPHQAVECCLFDLPPDGCDWTPRALDRVMEIAPDNETRVLEVVYPGDVPQIEIYFEDDNGEMVSVSEVLKTELHLFGNEEDDFEDVKEDLQGGDVDVLSDDKQQNAAEQELTEQLAMSSETEKSDPEIIITHTAESQPSDCIESAETNDGNTNISNGDVVVQGKLDVPEDETRTSDDSFGNLDSDSEYLTPGTSPEREQSQKDGADVPTTSEDRDPVNFESDFKKMVSLEEESEPQADDSIRIIETPETNNNINRTAEPPGDQISQVVPMKVPEMPGSHGDHNGKAATATESSDKSISESLLCEDGNLMPLPPPLEVPKTSSEDIFVTYVSDPWNFWVIKTTSRGQLLAVMEDIQVYYTQDLPLLRKEDLVAGQVYATLHDGVWYRALIKQVCNNSQVMVHFVDYGDFSLVSNADLRILPMEFRKLPFQAFQCKLEGVRPPGTEQNASWSLAAGQRLAELIEEKPMTAWILGKTDVKDLRNCVLSVTLVDMDNKINAFMHKILLEEGLAIK